MKRRQIERILEIIPGSISWGILIALFAMVIFNPLVASGFIILFLIFWACRLFYMSILLIMAHIRFTLKKNNDWLAMARNLNSDLNFDQITHLVLYPIYKEPIELIRDSMNALKDVDYPKENIIVFLAGEERAQDSAKKLNIIKEEFRRYFKDIVVTIHPKNIPNEIACKGANATYSAKQAAEYLKARGYRLEDIIISCFDSDTRADKNYFSCLTYHFLNNPRRYRTSFQPLPIYSNNIYKAPALSRIVEMGSTFWQLVESMRYEKFITFSSHSMSFKTLVEVGYWPVNLISDDSLIFWKCFLKYDGNYRTFPLEVPVYMDIAVGENLWGTIRVQYLQKRRWAWGIENFVFVGMAFLGNKRIKLFTKISKLYQILDSHINWATWAIITSFITPLMLLWSRIALKNSLVLFNLSYINTIIFNSLSIIVIISIFINREFLPPRPKEVSRLIYLSFLLQWVFVPVISIFLGSCPALDAQTRLMLGRYLGFFPTPKSAQRMPCIQGT